MFSPLKKSPQETENNVFSTFVFVQQTRLQADNSSYMVYKAPAPPYSLFPPYFLTLLKKGVK